MEKKSNRCSTWNSINLLFLSLWTSKQEKLSQEVPFVFRNMTLYKNYKGISINQTKNAIFLTTGKTTMTKNDDLKIKKAH